MKQSSTAKDATARLQSLLSRDKIQAPEGFSEILRADVTHLLANYFDLNGAASVDVKLNDDGNLKINLTATAERIRQFRVIK